MLLVILFTSLVTLVLLIVSTIAYLISIISGDTDVFDDSEGLDAHQFISTAPLSPVNPVSPAESSLKCTNTNHHHECEKPMPKIRTLSLKGHKLHNKFTELSCESDQANVKDCTGSKTPDENFRPNEADLFSLGHALKNFENEAEKITDADKIRPLVDLIADSPQVPTVSGLIDSPQNKSPQGKGQNPWEVPVNAVKDIIISQIGAPASKHLFDDFDKREMQLGGTALHWCKSRKSLDRLIRLGLPLDALNNRSETALHVAVRRKRLKVLTGLLCHGASVNCRNSRGETPLILAGKLSEIYACQLLLVFDADVDHVDLSGYSARHHVASICGRHKTKVEKVSPLAANLILAMLNELGAKRCPKMRQDMCNPLIASPENIGCSAGCSSTGTFNGNSYNKWPDFKRESLYKRHMFSDLIQELKRQACKLNTNQEPESDEGPPQATSRMLCIDGGGLRGIIVCQIMIELQKFLRKPLLSYFDWVGGTSVGAFVSCALCTGISLSELRRICFEVKDEIFSGNRPYNSKFLERVLKRTLGPTSKLMDLRDKKVVVTTVLADRDPCQLRFFRNYKSSSDLLEKFGYPAEKFDAMSGHSIVIRRPIKSLGGPSLNVRSVAGGINNISTSHTLRGEAKKSVITDDSASRTSKDGQKSGWQAKSEQASSSFDEQPDRRINKSCRSGSRERLSRTTSEVKKFNGSGNDSEIDEDERNPCVWQAVRASAAAPFFFKPYGPYVDGGIISNNPTLDMLSEFESYQSVRKFLRQRQSNKPKEEIEIREEEPSSLNLVVSLGTGRGRVIGRQAIFDFSQFASGFSTVFSPVELVRSIRAARDLFKKLMQRSCHTEDHVLDRAQAWCSSLKIPYFRINPPLASTFSIDDKRDEQLINAIWQAKLYMRAMKGQIEELRELLDGPE